MEDNHSTLSKESKFPKHFWNNLSPSAKTTLKLLPVILILAALPLTVWFLQFRQNLRSNAADIPPTTKSVTVSSIAALKTTLADNTVDEIIVANGTYRVSPASAQRADSLWIGSAYASRTKPITVRAETPLGVKLDGGGATYFGAISFEDGAHDQTWIGFEPINGNPTSTGVVVFGGYPNGGIGPSNITLRGWHFGPSLVGRADPAQWTGVSPQDHAIYISNSPIRGPFNLLFEDITVDQPLDGRIPLFAAFNIGQSHNYSTDGVIIRRLVTNGLINPWVTWAPSGYITPVRNVIVEDSQLLGYKATGVRVEGGFENLTFRNITTQKDLRYPGVGFYSSLGNPPAGVTLINNNFDTLPNTSPTLTPTKTPTPTPTKAPTPTNPPTPTPTPIPFKITSGPTVISISDTQATVQWYLSSGGNGQVEYGKTTNYGSLSTLEPSYTGTRHTQILSNLIPGTIYHYRIKSTNQTGTTVTSPDNIFVTTGGLTPTPTPATIVTPTPTISVPTPTPTTLNPGQTKKCLKILDWKFCF